MVRTSRWRAAVVALLAAGAARAAGRAPGYQDRAATAAAQPEPPAADGRATGPPQETGVNGRLAMLHRQLAQSIEAARLAQSRAASPLVRSFAHRLADDHRRLAMEVVSAALGDIVELENPPPSGGAEPPAVARLHRLHGDAFDHAYLDAVVAEHRSLVRIARRDLAAAKQADAPEVALNAFRNVAAHATEHLAAAGRLTRELTGAGAGSGVGSQVTGVRRPAATQVDRGG